MYYLVNSSSKEYIYINYYTNVISHENFSDSFKMYITDDIHKDFMEFDNRKINNPNGVVILPEDLPYFIILISNKSGMETIFHELTHAYDTYLFKKYFNILTNTEIRLHKYYKTFSFWTEYHAKTIELKYSKLFNKDLLINTIDDFLYLQMAINKETLDFWQNTINQYYCTSFHDVMWLFALINFAQKYAPNASLNARDNVTIPWDYYELLPVLKPMEDFSGFQSHIDKLEALVSPLPFSGSDTE